jgi:hypothetical protein
LLIENGNSEEIKLNCGDVFNKLSSTTKFNISIQWYSGESEPIYNHTMAGRLLALKRNIIKSR